MLSVQRYFLFSQEVESFNINAQEIVAVVSRFRVYLVPDGPCVSILKAINDAFLFTGTGTHRSTCFLGCLSGVA